MDPNETQYFDSIVESAKSKSFSSFEILFEEENGRTVLMIGGCRRNIKYLNLALMETYALSKGFNVSLKHDFKVKMDSSVFGIEYYSILKLRVQLV